MQHTFKTSGEAYDGSQCRDDVKDGDVLISEDGVVGFLFQAWPVAVTKNFGSLHTLASPIEEIEDHEPCHVAGFKAAVAVAKERGLELRD